MKFTFFKNLLKVKTGFTLIELLLVVALASSLIGFMTFNLLKSQRSTSVSAALDSVTSDIKGQQIKAMSGSGSDASFGIHFSGNTYVLFQGANFVGSLDNVIVPTDSSILLTGNDIVFLPATGEIKDFSQSSPPTITVKNIAGSEQKVIQFNKYGTIVQIN